MYRNIKTVLYHGTISEISSVDVSAGKNRKDFGQGFYMSESRQQAIGMMQKNTWRRLGEAVIRMEYSSGKIYMKYALTKNYCRM